MQLLSAFEIYVNHHYFNPYSPNDVQRTFFYSNSILAFFKPYPVTFKG